MAENMTRTILGSATQIALYMGRRPNIVANTTLNQKFEILNGSMPTDNEIYGVRYFGIGNGGHEMSIDNGIAIPKSVTHRYRDFACFNHIPFVVRSIGNDLTTEERAKYILRQRKTIGTSDYWIYWLKRIDEDTSQTVMQITDNTDGNSDTDEFIPSLGDLSPTQPTIDNTSIKATSGITLSAKHIVSMSLSAAEVQEVRNGCEILFGNADHAIISETAICTGVDRNVSITLNDNSTVPMKEGIAVQVAHFVKGTTFLEADSDKVWGIELDLGATEPLLDAN